MEIKKLIAYEITVSEQDTVSEQELKQLSAIFWAATHTTVDRSVPEQAQKFREIVNEVIY